MEPNGPCLYKLVTDEKFLEIDENLVSGFFAALHAFAKTIGSEEVQDLILKDISFSFVSKPNALIVAAADKGVDLRSVLAKVSLVFDEVFCGAETTPFNPLIPTDLDQIGQRITDRIKDVVATTRVEPHEKSEARRAGVYQKRRSP